KVREWFENSGKRALVFLVIVSAMVSIIIWTVRLLRLRRRKRREVVREYLAPSPDLLAAAKRFDRLLRSRGLPCAIDRTWREHVLALPQQSPIDHDRYLDFVNAYDDA